MGNNQFVKLFTHSSHFKTQYMIKYYRVYNAEWKCDDLFMCGFCEWAMFTSVKHVFRLLCLLVSGYFISFRWNMQTFHLHTSLKLNILSVLVFLLIDRICRVVGNLTKLANSWNLITSFCEETLLLHLPLPATRCPMDVTMLSHSVPWPYLDFASWKTNILIWLIWSWADSTSSQFLFKFLKFKL